MSKPKFRVSAHLVMAGFYAALTAPAVSGSITWPVRSGAPRATDKPPYLRIGECTEIESAVMGLRGSEVVVPVHAYRADGSAVEAAAMIAAAAGVLEEEGAVTATGRTIADVSLEGLEDAGIDTGDGKAEAHYIGRFRVWVR